MGIPANNSAGVSAAGTPPAGDAAHAVLSGTFTGVGPSQPFAFQGWANVAIWATVNTTLTTTAGSTSASVASGTGLAAGGSVTSKNVPPGTTWATLSGTAGTLAIPSQTYSGVMDEAGTITGMASTAGLLGAAVSGTNVPSGATVASVNSASSVTIAPAPSVNAPLNTPQSFTFAPTGNAVTGGSDAAATFTGSGLSWTGTVQIERSFDGGNSFICCNVGATGSLSQYTGGPINLVWAEPELGVLYRFNCTAYTSGTINYRASQTAGGAMSLTLGGVAY